MRLLRDVVGWLRRPAQSAASQGAIAIDCTLWRQGDVFDLDGIWTTGPGGDPTRQETPLGVAVISQSCDAAQSDRDLIHVVPVVLLDGVRATEAASGKRISYAALPELSESHFADLETVVTMPKSTLATGTRRAGVQNTREVRRFAGAVSRKYGRFAFPDEVVHTLDPLREVLRSKARKEQTPLGRVLAGVYGIRVEASLPGGWESPPYDLVLIVIFEPGHLPDFSGGELPDEPPGLRDRVMGKGGRIESKGSDIAGAVQKARSDDERYWLIMMLAESWAAQCEAAVDRKGVRGVVRSVTYDVATVDEFPLSRYNNSEDLDLDYLSDPLPRAAGGTAP